MTTAVNQVSAYEATSFMNKFKSLWQAGHTANLSFETQAGQAWTTLKIALGDHPNPARQISCKVSPSQKRHLQRRREAREAGKTNESVDINMDTTNLAVEAKNNDVNNQQVTTAVEATIEEVNSNKAATVSDLNKCVICEKEFESEKGLSTHQGRMHGGDIPQLDGCTGEEPDEDTFTFVSHYGEEDVVYTLKELLELGLVPTLPTLVSRERICDTSADHLCTVRLK